MAASEVPEDIKDMFDEYSENGVMGLDELPRFLVEVQREESATVEDAHAVMDSLNELKQLNIFHRRGLDLEAFFRYLFGDINSPLNPKLGWLGMLPGTWAYVSATAIGRAVIKEKPGFGLGSGGNGQLLALGLGLLATAIAATYVTRLPKLRMHTQKLLDIVLMHRTFESKNMSD